MFYENNSHRKELFKNRLFIFVSDQMKIFKESVNDFIDVITCFLSTLLQEHEIFLYELIYI